MVWDLVSIEACLETVMDQTVEHGLDTRALYNECAAAENGLDKMPDSPIETFKSISIKMFRMLQWSKEYYSLHFQFTDIAPINL